MDETSRNNRMKRLFSYLSELLAVAVLYYITARLGQVLAIPPGNVTPIWLPSGIMLAAVLIRGYQIWPGIFIGAFFGNVWAYADFSQFSSMVMCCFTGSFNGMGDVLCSVGAAYLIKRFTGTSMPIEKSSHVMQFFLFGCLGGPAISALFGVSSLSAAGLVESSRYFFTFMTWWTGDAVGVLVITPLILSFFFKDTGSALSWPKRIAYFLVLLLVVQLCIRPLNSKDAMLPFFAIVLVLIWSVFKDSRRISFVSVFLVSLVVLYKYAVTLTPNDLEAMASNLIELQWVLAIMGITILLLVAEVQENRATKCELEVSHKSLEQRVEERTTSLKTEIAERQRIEQEQDQLIKELKGALEEIKSLRSILPLCSYCKKVRDDKGYWEQVDIYISEHLHTDISHGICPDCLKEHYPHASVPNSDGP